MRIITYRRTGGIFALLAFGAAALAATVLTVAVAAILLIGALAMTLAARLARAVLPASWRRHTVPAATPWPQETIEGTVVNPTATSYERDRLRMDSGKG